MNFRLSRSTAAIVAVLAGLACGDETSAAPVIPGLHQKHPLDERQMGGLLINELRCASCHEGMDDTNMRAAPDLRQVGARLNSDYLQRFIADPATMHPGTTMPGMLAPMWLGLPASALMFVGASDS